MLRRPAPALAPAAWLLQLLLAGLLCGGEVWAARGKRRGRVGARGVGSRRKGRTSGAGSGRRRPRARAAGAAGEARLCPGRGTTALAAPIPPSPGWWLCGSRGRCRRAEGSVRLPQQLGGLGLHPWGEVPCTCVVCSDVHQAGVARTVFCCMLT